MPDRTMQDTMDSLGDELLDAFDQIARSAHARYRAYRPEDLIELDPRAQAACTYSHMLADCERRFGDVRGVRLIDIRGQKLWLFEQARAVVRLKKMDEDGRSRNYPTKQAKDFDAGLDLPGLPMPPVRLTAGYLLDRTASMVLRTQVARPIGRGIMWCGAIVPREERKAGERVWVDVTRQGRM